jgi:putative transposase
MPNYRRARLPGGSYFFTIVTYNRRPLFHDESAQRLLREAISVVRIDRPFKIDSFCLLPDHLHTIWTLPEDDNNFSQRWGAIKGHFSRKYREQHNEHVVQSGSRLIRGEQAFWQRRFWEHLIRDKDDFRRHFDYIHYNPVKHGLVETVAEWPWSSFHRCVRQGIYPADWCGSKQAKMSLVTAGE